MTDAGAPKGGPPTETPPPMAQLQAAEPQGPIRHWRPAVAYAVSVVAGGLPVFKSPDLWWVPVLAMLLYLVLGYGKAVQEGIVFEFGDSFYYLGFTLSVASLLAMLDPFHWTARPQDPAMVLRYFGLGLFTTLIGVIGRTVLQIFHRLPAETIEATNEKIEEQAWGYLETLKKVNSETRNILATTLARLRQELEGNAQQFATALRDLNKAVKRAAEQAEGLDVAAVETSLGTLVGTFEKAAKDLEQHTGRLKSSRVEIERATEAARDASDGVVRAAGEAGALVTSEFSATLSALSGQVHGFEAAVRGVVLEIAKLTIDPSATQQSLDVLGDAITSTTRELEASLTTLRESVQAYARGLQALPAEIGVATAAATQPAAADLARELRSMGAVVRAESTALQRDSLSPLRQVLTSTVEELRTINTAIDEIVEAVKLKLETLG
jgi:hypothetical protein